MTTQPAEQASGIAYARAGLLGNPSDGYGGRVIAVTLPSMAATIHVTSDSQWSFSDTDASHLLEATIEALRARRPSLVVDPARLSLETTIPRQVGLAGSSAIIIAALRALAVRVGLEWSRIDLARLALEVETDVLGWSAGPQDRVVQAYEGLLDMDFSTPWNSAGYEQLDASLLPQLLVAYRPDPGQASDIVHADVQQRWLAGDADLRHAMTRFAAIGAEGRATLDQGTAAQAWPALMNEAFDLRSRFWDITEVDTELVETGQSLGAGVAFAGSGGAVVATIPDPSRLTALESAYSAIGAGSVVISR